VKHCNNCQETKPIDEFSRNKSSKDGRQYYCKACQRAWRDANKEKRAEQNRAYREANRDKIAEKGKAYYQANRDKTLERQKAYQQSIRDKVLEYHRAYYQTNREKKTEYRRAYYRANKDKYAEYRKSWDQNNPDKRRAQTHRRRARKECAVPQRWQKSECPDTNCYWCGVDLSTVKVELDHIMPISLGGEAKPYNEAPSCRDCNRSKNSKHPLVWIADLV
jgi:5-methylcytosine-specific restriction endonuclease McrA